MPLSQLQPLRGSDLGFLQDSARALASIRPALHTKKKPGGLVPSGSFSWLTLVLGQRSSGRATSVRFGELNVG